MRILFIVAYPAEARVRPRELIRTLARRGHKLTVATLWETETDRTGLENLQAQGIQLITTRQTKAHALWNCLRALPTNQPLQAHYSWNPALARAIEHEVLTTHYDVIHIEHLRTARYGLWLKSKIENRQLKIPVVWDSVDCISHLFEQSSRHGRGFFARVITRLELPRTRRYEGRLVGQFDRVMVTSPVDAAALTELANRQSEIRNPKSKITILPNGVDLTYFAPQPVERDPETLVYLGRMSYHANVAAVTWFCREVLPLIWAARPGVRLFIVGMNPGPAVRALAQDPRITVTGTVPDVRPYLARATALVAPMVYGAGIQNKVLEAMATGTPVICTTLAASALEAETGRDLVIADGTANFAAAVLHLLSDPNRQRQLGRAGRRYVEQHHDWDGIAARLEEIDEQLLASSPRQGGRG